MADLAAAQKEFPRLGKFCKRIVEQTDALQKAEILENSMDKLRKMPAQKITPSEFEGWLQAFAVIMGVGNPQFAPDVRMETITQFGLLDLMTKFDNGDQTSTEKYYQSTESLQQFLKSRFLLIKDSPRLKEKANEIHWASEVLYYDRRVDLNSDLARYETWLKADETLQITIPKLNRARAQARQYTLIEELKARAAMSNKETTSQDKSAAIILLCILGCTTPKTGHLFEEAQASTKQMALNAIKEFLPSEGGTSSSHRTEVSIFPHNAQRVVQFHQSYLFPNELMHHKNFKEIIVAGETSGPIFKIMKYNVLTRAIEQEPELTKAFQSSTKSILERQEILKDFMNMLTGSYTNQMPAAKFEICIQTIAVLMKVADAKPCAVEFENEVDSGLLKLMDKFRGKEDPESIKFYESARNLQFFLKSRRERYQTKNNEVILTDKGKSVA